MNFKSLAFLVLVLCFNRSLLAADKEISPSTMEEDVKRVLVKIQEKAHGGSRSAAEFTAELSDLDSIIDRNKDKKTEDFAQVLLLKAQVYSELLGDNKKALEVAGQIKTDLPETPTGQRGEELEKFFQRSLDAETIRATLVPGAAFPNFEEKDLQGAPLSLSKFKGKVVLVDFWATWCPPCLAELPNVIAAYEKYHDKGFEIVGISLDKEAETLTRFIKIRKMPWSQSFDGRSWDGKLVNQYGIVSIPSTFLLDGEGKIIASNLRGPELEGELEKRLK